MLITAGHLTAQQYGSFKDSLDGRIYKTVKIGSQVWMAENLVANTFRNGDKILEALSKEEWLDSGDASKPVSCLYEYDEENEAKYGRIYNGVTVFDQRGIAPEGWHIPTNDDWNKLIRYLGGEKVAGLKLKSKSGWDIDWMNNKKNGNGTNSSGFSALPGGYRDYSVSNSIFLVKGTQGYWWSSTFYNKFFAWGYSLSNGDSAIRQIFTTRGTGMYIRCIKD